MSRNKLTALISFLLVLLIMPSVFAFNCEFTGDYEYCESIVDSNINDSEKDLLISSLLYPYSNFPNHAFVEEYNLGIEVSQAPLNVSIRNSQQIRDAWLSFSAIMPSILEKDELYVQNDSTTLCEFNYSILVPENYISKGYSKTKNGDCKTEYSLVNDEAELIIYSDNNKIGEGKLADVNINGDSRINAKLNIETAIKIDHYGWHSWCCASNENGCTKTCHSCNFKSSNTESDSISLEEYTDVKVYKEIPIIDFEVVDAYNGMIKGVINATNYSTLSFSSENFSYVNQKYAYEVVFDKKPYYFATLNAVDSNFNKQKNINLNNNDFVVSGSSDCSLTAFNHFSNFSYDCNLFFNETNNTKLEGEDTAVDLDLFIYLLVAGLIIYFFYKLIKVQWKKVVLVLILILVFVPLVSAEELESEEERECGILNLASCIPEKLYDFFIYLVNAPIQPILIFIKTLLTSEVHINIFKHVWKVITYILSFFYLFLFLYAGFTFLTSSENPIKRAHAKDSLKNAFLMIMLIQGSFFIYGLVLSLSSVLNSAILSLIDEHFFMITFDNLINIGLEFTLFPIYLIDLLLAMFMLCLRYIVVSLGVVLFPLGIFCYYVPSLRSYGRFIIHLLANFIFITFIDLLIILACSMIITDPLFESFKIVVMITCFSIINYSLFWCIKFAMSRVDTSGIKDDVGQAVKYLALVA